MVSLAPRHHVRVLAVVALIFAATGCREGFPSASRDSGLDTIADTTLDTRLDSGADGTADAGRGDASADASMACVPSAESCNDADDDCDGRVDEDFSLDTSISNCGSCSVSCPSAPHATPTCTKGACGFSCTPGFADCDELPDNGCEASLSASETCGMCDRACAVPMALCETEPTPRCVSACSGGLSLCGTSCVDLSTDTSNCGSCGTVCESRANAAVDCVAGTCQTFCLDGFASCDSMEATGCETSIETVSDCGACGTPCTLTDATPSCTTGSCEIVSCVVGRGDCDGITANGCESSAMHFWPDVDDDTWGANGPATIFCDPPYPTMGFAPRTGDCDDADPRVFPGQTTFFSTPAIGGGYDYNCDSVEAYRWRATMLCISGALCMIRDVGWRIVAPTCGVEADWVTDCTGTDPCDLTSERRRQQCR